MATSILQASLVGGELTPSAHGRTDVQRYGASLRKCRRFIVTPHGGVTKSTGFRFVDTVSTPVYLERFRTSTDTHFLLVFGHYTLDIYLNGARVTNPLPGLRTNPVTFGDAISNIRYPMLCADASFTAGMVGRVIFARGSESTQSVTAWRVYEYVSAGEILVESLDYSGIGTDFPAIPVDGYSYWSVGPNSSSTWPGRPVQLTTPWRCGSLDLLRVAQINDVMTIVHPDTPPMRLERRGEGVWALANDPIVNGPFGEWDTTETAITVALGTDGFYKLTASAPIFRASNVGQLLEVEPRNYGAAWQAATSVAAGDVKRSEGNYYRASIGGVTGTLPPAHTEGEWSDGVVTWEFVSLSTAHFKITGVSPDAGGFTNTAYAVNSRSVPPGLVGPDPAAAPYCPVTLTNMANVAGRGWLLEWPTHGYPVGSVLQCYVVLNSLSNAAWITGPATVVDANHVAGPICELAYAAVYENPGLLAWLVVASASSPAGSSVSPRYDTTKWRWSPFSPANGYPRSVVYHQQRKVFGGCYAFPQTVWASRTGLYNDFGVSFPSTDDDAFTLTLDASDVSRVQGLLSIGRILIFTSCGEWTLSASTPTAPITATDRAFQQYGARGCADINPLVVDDAAMFVQQKRRTIRDLDYEYSKDRYVGTDVAVAAAHLLEARCIVSWAYEAQPYGVVWMTCDDGMMLGCTFMREQQVVAWHRHDRMGKFLGVCTVPEEGDDTLYAVCRVPSLRAPSPRESVVSNNAMGCSDADETSGMRHASVSTADLVLSGYDVGRKVTLVWPVQALRSGANGPSFSATITEVTSRRSFRCYGYFQGAPIEATPVTVTVGSSWSAEPLSSQDAAADLVWVAGNPGVPQPAVLTLSGTVTRDFEPSDVGRVAYLRTASAYVSARITDVIDEKTAYCGWFTEEPEWGTSFTAVYGNFTSTLGEDENGFATLGPMDLYDLNDTIERAGSRLQPYDPMTPYLDSCVVYGVNISGRVRSGASSPVGIETSAAGEILNITFGGLRHLDGLRVTVACAGKKLGEATVDGDRATLYITGNTVAPSGYYVVGLPYTAEIKTLDIDFQSAETSRDKNKSVGSVNVLCRCINSGDELLAGPSAAQLNYSMTPTVQSWSDGAVVYNVVMASEWSKRGSVLLRSAAPGPLDILSVIPVIHVS